MRILLRVAYDGTSYAGWQFQNNAVTVEEMLQKAINELFNSKIDLIGASRTDSGVHALGNVAVFDVDTRIPPEKILYALNARLPEDIRVTQSIRVKDDFHPRHTNCTKTYEYSIWNDKIENPKERLYSHFYYGELDIDRMKEAAVYFTGEHDFTSFCAAGTQVISKVRTINSLEVCKEGHKILIRITGNGFLYNMVRIIAGTLLKVGQGEIEPSSITSIIDGRDRQLAGPTAPARGLTLIGIEFEELLQ